MKAKRRRNTEPYESQSPRLRRLRRWLIGLPLLAVGTIVLLWSVPVIVAKTSLRQSIVSAALSDFEGSVTIGSASLGWLSPLLAHDIEARDGRGQPLGHVKSLRSEKSLLGLLSDPSQPGVFRVEEPKVQLVLRPDGSNWEDALAKLLSEPSQGAAVQKFTVQIEGGTLEVRDAASETPWQWDDLRLAMQWDEAAPLPIKVRAAGLIGGGGRQSGPVSVDWAWKPGDTDATYYGNGQLTLRGQSLPLAAFSSLAQRFLGDIQAQGTADCDALWQWTDGGQRQRMQIDRLETGPLVVRAPAWLGSDVLRTDYLRGSAQLESAGTAWNVERLTVDSEFARLSAQGVLQANDITSMADWAQFVSQVPDVDLKLEGRVDVAKLAGMLPTTLNLRETTQVKSGLLNLSLESKAGNPPRLAARLEATDLAAIENGQEFTWEKPILVTANLRRSPDGPVIDELICRSSFLDVSAKGTLSQGTAAVRGDLHQLTTDAGRFIDLTGYQMAGRVDGNVRWQHPQTDQVAADGRLKLNDFELSSSGQPPWREKELTVDLAATAELTSGRINRVLSASLRVHSGSDELRTDLLQPVVAVGDAEPWPLRLKARGNLATWLPRLSPFVPVGDRQLGGVLNLDATARVSAQSLTAEAVKLQIDQFQSREWDLAIDEPTIRVDAKASWDAAQGRVTAQDVTMTSSTVAFRAQQVVLQMPTAGPAVSGKLSYRADLGRIGQWLQKPGQAADQQLSGSVTGTLEANHEAGMTQVSWTSDAENMVFATRKVNRSSAGPTLAAASSVWEELWREPSVKLISRERYDHQRDVLEVQELSATASVFRLVAAGRIEEFRGRQLAELSGEVDYDWTDVSKKLSGFLGKDVQITGQDKGRFALRGPLRESAAKVGGAPLTGDSATGSFSQPPRAEFRLVAATGTSAASGVLVPPALAGSGRLGWESGSLYGLLLGKGELKAALEQGVLRFAPLQVPVSEGRFQAVSRIELNAAPMRLLVDQGQLVDNVRISPELCHTWLKYVAPLLADATRAEGRFSVMLDGAKVPLTDTAKSDMHGQLTIHSAQVGPGPLAQEFLTLSQQVKTILDNRPASASQNALANWLMIPEQTVRVDVQDGRVHHQGLTMTSGDVLIRTSGSVGLDESLAIMAEVPIRDEWVSNKKYLSSLRGTTIQIPLQGTLSKPRLDNRMLRELSTRMIGGAARGVLQDEVNRGLQRLFGPATQGGGSGTGGAP